MGYYVTLVNSTAVIPADKLDEAYQRFVELNKRDDLKTGGAYGGPDDGQRWFSWMDPDYPSKCKDAAEVLQAVGYEVGYLNEGGLEVYSYDNKTGCEDTFMEAIADLVTPGSFMEWRGEDGAQSRWIFDGTKKIGFQSGRVVYE